MTRLLRTSSLVLFLLWPLVSYPSSVRCLEEGIKGMEHYAANAHRFVGSTTSDMSNAVLYVEKTERGIYLHSNYQALGAPNPTKIWTDEHVNLDILFLNVVFPGAKGGFSLQEQLEGKTALKHAQVILDESMFTEGGYPLIDIGDAKNVAIVDGDTGETLVGPVDRLERTSPPPVLMSRVVGCCLFGIPPHLAAGYQRALEARPLAKDNIRFLSLVRDSGTETAIKSSKTLRAARLGESGAPISSLAQIDSAFSSAQGKTVVLMSHVEGENFVTRDAARRIVSSIPVQSVRSLAAKCNVELIDIGCETAQQLRAEKLGIGVATKFNTVDAVRALDRAISASSNYSEFFQSLTSENLTIVVDHGFMQKWPLCADVYGKAAGRSMLVKLARIFVNFSSDMDMSKFEQPKRTTFGAAFDLNKVDLDRFRTRKKAGTDPLDEILSHR
jgi:hypothetical protein